MNFPTHLLAAHKDFTFVASIGDHDIYRCISDGDYAYVFGPTDRDARWLAMEEDNTRGYMHYIPDLAAFCKAHRNLSS